MTDRIAKCLTIPVWVITLIIPVFITIMGALIVYTNAQSAQIEKLQHQSEIVKEMRIEIADKVSRTEFNEIRTYFLRLEDKVDRLIERRP